MFRIINLLFHTKSTTIADQCCNKQIPADIFETHILSKLDAATLASTVSVFPQLFFLCKDDKLWRKICNSIWPSTTDPRVLHAISAFPSAHRSFYSDSFPSSSHRLPRLTCLSDTSSLISAVDIYYKDQVIYSKVLETETVSDRFFGYPLKLNLLGTGEMVPTPVKYNDDHDEFESLVEEHLRVSWIVIDPCKKRAVNIASHKAVHKAVRSWFEEVKLYYATVAAVANGKLVQFAVNVTCRWMRRAVHLTEVSMEIVDIAGKRLNGRESMGILQTAMEGGRRRIDSKMEKDNYKKFKRKSCCYPCCIFF